MLQDLGIPVDEVQIFRNSLAGEDSKLLRNLGHTPSPRVLITNSLDHSFDLQAVIERDVRTELGGYDLDKQDQ